MSLDHTLVELQNFRDALEKFVEVLRACRAEQDAAEERLRPLWDDAFQREFASRYGELDGPVRAFLDRDAERFGVFVDDKIHRLRDYLHGH